MWRHNERRLKDHLGHYVYPRDFTGDGVDEVLLSSLMLDAEEAYHMFDFMGNGAEQVVALNKQTGVMKIYGSTEVRPKSV